MNRTKWLVWLLVLIFTIVVSSTALAQSGSLIHRHRQYDTTLSENKPANWQKHKRRRLTTAIDSTGIFMTAWDDDCWLKIKLRNKADVMDHYTSGMRNGYPYVKYGNDKYRYRMYMTKGGSFEFDAIIRSKPANGQYFFPFDIQTRGLSFYYQPELTPEEIALGAERPDSVIGSYAVYRSDDKRGNYKRADGSTQNYTTGKVFHIYTPKAWDSVGDTVWGVIEIDTLLGRMKIGVDSTWMANATYPVTIDPQFGNMTAGASGQSLPGLHFAVEVTMDAVSGQVLDSLVYRAWSVDVDGSKIYAAIYDDDTGPDARLEQETVGILMGYNVEDWYQVPMAGTLPLTSSATYWLAGRGSNTRMRYDASPSGVLQSGNSFPDPFGAFSSGNWNYSIYGVYSAAPTGGASIRRRRIIMNGVGQ